METVHQIISSCKKSLIVTYFTLAGKQRCRCVCVCMCVGVYVCVWVCVGVYVRVCVWVWVGVFFHPCISWFGNRGAIKAGRRDGMNLRTNEALMMHRKQMHGVHFPAVLRDTKPKQILGVRIGFIIFL